MNQNTYSVLFILRLTVCSILLLTSCGSHHDELSTTSDTGSLIVSAQWPDQATPVASNMYRTAPVNVTTVRILISASDMSAMQQDFTAAAGTGTISGIPAGLGRSVTVEGLDSAFMVIYAGSVGNVTVTAGQTTDCGSVTMTPIGNGAIPAPPTTVTATAGTGQITLDWTASANATSYNIYWSMATGVSKATGTKISVVPPTYVHNGLSNVNTYYYVVTAVNGSSESAESSQASAMPF